MTRAHTAAALAAALLGAACVDGDYNRSRVFQEPLSERLDALAVGTSDVSDALEQLGAPVHVIEVGLGLALAWGWSDVTDWNIEVSAPLGEAQGNFRFTSTDTTTEGLVLFFGPDWRLTALRRGYLGELLPRRQLPRDVEDELVD